MKRVLIIIIIVAVFLLGIILALPVLFRPAIEKTVRSTLAEKVSMPVNFSKIDISLLKKFPAVTVEIQHVLIRENEVFAGDTLFYARSAVATTSWKSLIGKSGKSIDKLVLRNPSLNFKVNESGRKNWEFDKIAGDVNSVQDKEIKDEKETGSFGVQLENIQMFDAGLSLDNKSSKTELKLNGLNMELSGKMYNPSALVHAEAAADDVNLTIDRVNLLSHAKLETKTLLEVESESKKILIMNNELQVNRLPLELSGSVEYPADSVFLNMLLKTREPDFNNFMALLPGTWLKNLSEAKTSGIANATARIKGFYQRENFPAFTLNVDVREGNINLKGRTEDLKNISVDAKVSKPQGPLQLTKIVVNKAHAELNGTPLDLKLNVSDLSKNAFLKGALVGGVNFNDLKNFLSLDSVRFSGALDVNLFFDTNYADIKNESYEKVKVSGLATMNNFVYDSPLLTRKILIPQGMMELSPQQVFLRKFQCNVGESKFELSGKLSRYLDYIFSGGNMDGTLTLSSRFVNFNELLRLKKREKPVPDEKKEAASEDKEEPDGQIANPEEEILAITFPGNLSFSVQSGIERAVFDRVQVSNIKGLITLQNGVLNLNGLSMNFLEGEMNLTGSYRNTEQNFPLFDFGLNLTDIDVKEAGTKLTSLRRMLPVLGYSQGEINAAIQMNGRLSPGLKIVGKTVNGEGSFSTRNLQIKNAAVFKQLEGILRPEKLRNVSVDDFKGNFVITDGNIRLQPFKTKVADQETAVRGNISADNTLDLRLDWKIQRDAFGDDIRNILEVIPGNEKIKVVPAGVVIQGPAENPEVKMDLSETRKTVAEATKGELQNSLDRLGKSLKKLFEK